MSLRDRLRSRSLPTTTVAIVADRAAFDAAEREYDDAARALAAEQARGSFDLDAERARVAAAQTALDALQAEVFTLRALPPAEWEALIEAHPPTPEQLERGAQWNPSAFRAALLAASVVVPDGEAAPSEQDWLDYAAAGQLSAGELNTLFDAAIALNGRAPQVSTGKG